MYLNFTVSITFHCLPTFLQNQMFEKPSVTIIYKQTTGTEAKL